MAQNINDPSNNGMERPTFNNGQVCLVKSRTAKRKTPKDIEKNVIVCNTDKAVELIQKGNTYHEVFTNDCWTKIYLDIERDDYVDEPSDDVKKEILDACIETFMKCNTEDDEFDQDKHIAIAQRHRWVIKNGNKRFKVSYRFWITRYAIRYTHIPYFMKTIGLDVVPIIDVSFDMKVYNNNNQLLGCVLNCKDKDDLNNPLKPITDHPVCDFIAQHLTGEERTIDMSSVIPEKSDKKEKVMMPPSKEEAIQLLNMLSKARCDDRNDWLRVGWCLKSVDESLESDWIEWSKKSRKFDELVCYREWRSASPTGGLTIGTLKYWAKSDSPGEYAKLRHDKINRLVYEARCGTDYDVANLIKNMYDGEFVCASIKDGTWYWYNNHRWNLDEKGHTLFRRISTEAYRKFMEAVAYWAKRAADPDCSEEEQARINDDVLYHLRITCCKLKGVTKKNALMTELAHMFFVPKFMDALDAKPNLLGFKNGVYDLDKMEFRAGIPEDYLSLSTGYDYTPKVIKVYRDAILDFFTSIQDSEEMRDYLLLSLAMTLHGTKKNQLVFFWVGKGANGKGTTVVLLIGSLGEYFYAPPIEMYTTKRKSSSAANPEMHKAKGVRAMVSTEPEQDEILYVALIKAMTGGDTISARPLYGNPTDFILQAFPIIQMNVKPALSGNDGGVKRRLRNITFPFRFCENPQFPNDRKMSLELGDKFKNDVNFHQQFMLLLLEIYDSYRKGGFAVKTPQKVLDETEAYLKENDHVSIYLSEHFEPDPERMVSASEAYKNFPNKKTMRQSAFNQQVEICGFDVKKCRTAGEFRDKLVIMGLKKKCLIVEEQRNDYD